MYTIIGLLPAPAAINGEENDRISLVCPTETIVAIDGEGQDRCCARVRLVPELTGPGANDPDVFIVNDYGTDPQPLPDDIHRVVFSGRITQRFDRANIFGLDGDRTTTYTGHFTYSRGSSNGPVTKTDQVILHEFTLTAGDRVFVGRNPRLHIDNANGQYRFVVGAGLSGSSGFVLAGIFLEFSGDGDNVTPIELFESLSPEGFVSARGGAFLISFFTGFVAWFVGPVDVADYRPSYALNACFPLGETRVRFTAWKGDGQLASCDATVLVVDRVPPTIIFCPESP